MAVPNEFVAGTRIDPAEVNANFDYVDGRVDDVVEDVEALQVAPPSHASSHASAGADSLYKTGTDSFTTDGTGAASRTVTHGLGATPSFVHITMTSGALDHTPQVTARTSTTFTVVFIGGAGFSGYSYMWKASR